MGKYESYSGTDRSGHILRMETETKYLLGTEDLWCHVSENADPERCHLGTPSHIPIAVISGAPTADELRRSGHGSSMISRANLTSLAGYLLLFQQLVSSSHRVSARAAWRPLKGTMDASMSHLQHGVSASIHSLHMKRCLRTCLELCWETRHSARTPSSKWVLPYPEEDCHISASSWLPSPAYALNSRHKLTFFPRAAPFSDVGCLRSHLRAAFRADLPRQHVRSTRTNSIADLA